MVISWHTQVTFHNFWGKLFLYATEPGVDIKFFFRSSKLNIVHLMAVGLGGSWASLDSSFLGNEMVVFFY